MSSQLPLFPLGLVAFPNEALNLHVFEPRYKQLITECHLLGITFGIVPVVDGRPANVGTEMKLLEISKTYDDGKMDVKTLGLRRFKMNDYYSTLGKKLYPGGEVVFLDEDKSIGDPLLYHEILAKAKILYDILKLKKTVPTYHSAFRVFDLAHKLGLNLGQEKQLLMLASEPERIDFLLKHLSQFIPMVKEMEELKRRVKMNGHFKKMK